MKDSLKPLFLNPEVRFTRVFHDAVAWMIVARLLRDMRPGANLDSYLLVLILAVFGLEVLIANNWVSASNVLGAIVGLVLWWSVVRRISWQAGTLAFLLCAVLTADGLAPFTLRLDPLNFNWLPFHGLLDGSMYVNAQAISEKMFLYGSLFYLLWQTHLRPIAAIAIAFVVLTSIEAAQVFVADHTPEVTDPLLLVLVAMSLLALKRHEDASSPPLAIGPSARQTAPTGSTPRAVERRAGPVEHTINLRRSQAEFLDQLSQVMGVDASGVCRMIIDSSLRSVDGAQRPDSRVAAATASPDSRVRIRASGDPGRAIDDDKTERDWTTRTIALDRGQARALARLVDQNDSSVSRSLRHLIAAFMEESAGSSRRQ